MTTGEELFGKRCDRGQVIFREGDSSDTMYVIQAGEVELTQKVGGQDVVLAKLERGEFFGEMALLGHMPRTATATAVRRTRLLPITLRTLLDRAEEDHTVVLQLLGALSVRLARATQMVDSLIAEDTQLRTAWEATKGPAAAQEAASGDQGEQPPDYEFLLAGDSSSYLWYDPDQIIFRQGDTGEAMYFIIEGAVEISRGKEGQTVRISVLGPHEFFGEMALITGAPRTATATTMLRTGLLAVSREEFLAKIGSKPALGMFTAQVLITRLRGIVAKRAG